MMLYKAVRPDGTDFRTGTVDWARPGEVVTHPTSETAVLGDFSTFLSVSTDPTRLPGSSWPLRLFTVEAAADAPVSEVDTHKRGSIAWRVVEEVPGHLRFGPQGEHVVALIDRASALTASETRALRAAWEAPWYAARDAAGYAARDAAGSAAWYAAGSAAAWSAARDAAGALVARDLIGSHGFTQAHYDTLTGPWRKVIGPVHPDDKDLR